MELCITIKNLFAQIEREKRMRHFETMQQFVDLNPTGEMLFAQIEREKRLVNLNQRGEILVNLNQRGEMFVDLNPIGEMLVNLNQKGEIFVDLNPIGEMLVNLNQRGEIFVDLNPIGEMLVNLNQRQERLVDLNPIGEMVGDLNPRQERETRNERAFQRDWVELIKAVEMMEHYKIQWVGDLNPRQERETRNERAFQHDGLFIFKWVELIEAVDMFVDLNPIGDMLVDLNPIGEMFVDLNPMGAMMENCKIQALVGLNPIREMFVDLNPMGAMMEHCKIQALVGLNPIREMLVDLNPIGDMFVDLNPMGAMMEHCKIHLFVDLNPMGAMMEHCKIQWLVDLNPKGEMVDDLNSRQERETRNERAFQRYWVEQIEAVDMLDDHIQTEEMVVDLIPMGAMIKYSGTQRLVDLNPIGEMMEHYKIQWFVDLNPMGTMAILNADTIEVCLGKQEVHFSNRRSCHGSKLLKSSLSLAPFFLPSAGGTGHGSGQPEHQGHSEIYPSTLNVVSNCPSRGEYMQTSLTKCAEVCGSYMQDGNCAYHCMRDSSKTKLVEFCAKPKPFFDYCPEYDPVDQTIQKDFATLCNSTSTRNYYDSSDIYFCDPNNCLQLHESSVRNGATTLTTLMNETTEMNDGDSQEWILPLFIVLAALLAVIIIGYILFRVFGKRGIFSEMRRNRNQNGKQYVYTRKRIPDYV